MAVDREFVYIEVVLLLLFFFGFLVLLSFFLLLPLLLYLSNHFVGPGSVAVHTVHRGNNATAVLKFKTLTCESGSWTLAEQVDNPAPIEHHQISGSTVHWDASTPCDVPNQWNLAAILLPNQVSGDNC